MIAEGLILATVYGGTAALNLAIQAYSILKQQAPTGLHRHGEYLSTSQQAAERAENWLGMMWCTRAARGDELDNVTTILVP